MKNKNKNIKLFLFLILLMAGFFGFSFNSNASTSIIINEIATSQTGSVKNEFIELYNPTGLDINLSEYKLKKKAKSGAESYLVSPSSFTGTIPTNGYFLISPPEYRDVIAADLSYSGASYSIADDNTILLYDAEDQLIDKVGYGLAPDFEKQAAINPSTDKSIERKNFQDTDNNSADFNWPDTPTPRNSLSDEDDSEEKITCSGNSSSIKINEIYPNTEDEGDEFVEIVNTGEDCADVSGWKIMDSANHQSAFPENSLISAGGYLYLQKKLYLNNDTDMVYLLDAISNNKESAWDKISYSYEPSGKKFSYSFDRTDWLWTSQPTPGTENEFDLPTEDTEETDNGISGEYNVYFNEILPNPRGEEKDNEYIELLSGEDSEVDLSGWILKDKTNVQYVFPAGTKIKPEKFLLIYRSDFKFALNNSGEETVYLQNPNKNIVSSVSYNKTREGLSYNFDGKNWRWSNKLTPGENNKFNNLPEVSKKKDNKIYVNVYAAFSAKGYDKDKDKLKFTWDFGDGHKSYKKETRHKFKKKGKYKVTLKVSDGSEDKIETFNIKVEKFPKSKVKIVSVSPNPKGKDSDFEFVVLQNKSKKKINLKDWSVATGSKKLYNHPITEDIVVKPGKTITLTREFSKFSLNNKKAKIELRYPDGKVASKLAYDKKKKSVAEDEIYTKESGQWAWVAPKTETKLALTENSLPVEAKPRLEIEVLAEPEIILASGQKFSEDETLRKLALANFTEPQGIVLGAATFRPTFSEVNQPPNKNSYLDTLLATINFAVNYLLNKVLFFLN